MPLTIQTTTILAEFVGTKQRWSWYPVGVKIRHLPGKSSRRLGQFGARATRKIALRYSVSVGRSEKPLRPVPATGPSNTLNERCECGPMSVSAIKARWGLFGHVMRMAHDTPAQMATDEYITPTATAGWQGRPRTTLPTTLDNDLQGVGKRLRNKQYLQ